MTPSGQLPRILPNTRWRRRVYIRGEAAMAASPLPTAVSDEFESWQRASPLMRNRRDRAEKDGAPGEKSGKDEGTAREIARDSAVGVAAALASLFGTPGFKS